MGEAGPDPDTDTDPDPGPGIGPRRRRLLAVGVLAVLFGLAGCLGGGGIDQSALAENQTYAWDVGADVSFNLSDGGVYAVHDVENGSAVEVYRSTEFQGNQPVSVSAVKFRYDNGTVVNSSAVTVERSGGRTVLTPPAADGQLAYTTGRPPKDFGIGVDATGSYEVILPPRMRIGVPVFGQIAPGGAELSRTADDRVRLHWDSLDGANISLSYYLERDFWLVVGIAALGLLAGVGGVLYYRYQIRQLQRRRERSGLEMER